MIAVMRARAEDVLWISSRLRDEDVEEIRAASGMEPETVLPLSFECSSMCFIMKPISEDPVAIFGVSDDPVNTGLGIVWLLATKDVGRHALGVLEAARMYLNLFLDVYPEGLHNIVDARNAQHLRWCDMLGFEQTAETTIRGNTFVHIYKGSIPNDNHV